METQALERHVGSIQNQAAAIAIKDQATYDRAVNLLGVVKSIQDGTEIKEMREAVSKAHEAHSAALKVWHRFWDPLEKVEKLLKVKILDFDRRKKAEEDAKQRALEVEEQRRRDVEARRIRDEAEKKAREDAAKVQRDRTLTKAEKKATIEDIKSSVAVVAEERIATVQAAPMPTVAPTYERSSAAATRQNWKADFEGATAEAKFNSALKFLRWVGEDIPSRAYLLELEDLVEVHPSLNNLAKDRKQLAVGKIPGVRIYDAGSVAARAAEPF